MHKESRKTEGKRERFITTKKRTIGPDIKSSGTISFRVCSAHC